MIHTTEYGNEIVVVRPGVERLTAVNAAEFKADVVALIEGGSSQLIVDFEDVTFMDSSALGALVGILKKIGHRGDIVICGLDEDLEQMFRISRMDRVFTAYPDTKAAIQGMTEKL